MIVRSSKGRGISGAVRYVLGEGKRDPVTGLLPQLAPGSQSRVAWYGGTGYGFAIDNEQRLDIARRQMEWAALNQASATKGCTQDCMHLMLAWDRVEHPGRIEMEAAAHSVLKHLGMERARAIWVAHNDTAHPHLHMVISRIDPDSGYAFRDSYDKLKLSEWGLAWEREHGGVRCEARLDREFKQVEHDPDKIATALAARRETFTAFDLNRELTGAISSRDMRREFIAKLLARPEMIALADPASGQLMRYTTRQTLAAEHLAEVAGARLVAEGSHHVPEQIVGAVAESLKLAGKALRSDQIEALRHATREEGLAVIAGKAGTGKSFTMLSIAAAYRFEGYAVQSLAPTNKVASSLKRDGLEAATIHSALRSLDRGKIVWNDKTVIMVDEAGMISTRLMARLLSYAEHAAAKVVLLGDDKQLASMDRGGMFGFFAERYGSGELSEITRQRGPEQRELAMRASRYDFAGALATLDRQGGIITVEAPDERIARAAELWGERTAAAPDKAVFVVTVSNADAAAANLAIREIRRGRGEIGADQKLATVDGLQDFAKGDRVLFSGTAGNRDLRAAGLVNGNAGVIAAIEGKRVSVALDGGRAGELVSFTVGKDRAAGEFDALRLGYAGTIYKAQGATYNHAIIIDSRNMRASAGYVALTRHREGVTVVAARHQQAGFENWMAGQGGLAGLTAAQRENAEKSYENWRSKTNPEAGRRHGFGDYVAYVQGKEAERRAQGPDAIVADLVKRWSRVDDRRAASRFEPLNYQPPEARRLTPAEVRAAVGIEAFEQERTAADALPVKSETALPPLDHVGGEVVPLRPNVPPTPTVLMPEITPLAVAPESASRKPETAPPAARLETAGIEPGLPTEEMLRQQAEQEGQRLRQLQAQEQWAQAFRRAKDIEADEARKKRGEHEAAEARSAAEGDISSASARYAIALGENYDVRDPYASLARAAMSEYAMFHRNQEKMREEMAREPDAGGRRVIELRRQIEAMDYMAITSERLAGISVAITGRSDAEQAVSDRARAVDYRAQAAALRTERSALIEAGQKRGLGVATPVVADRVGAGRSELPPEPASKPVLPALVSPLPAAPIPAVKQVPAVPELRQPSAKAPEPVPLAIATPAPVAKTPEAAPPERLSLVTINPALRRLDVIAPPSPPPRVAIAKTPEGGLPPQGAGKELRFGLDRERPAPDKSRPPAAEDKERSFEDMLTRRAEQAKDRDKGGRSR